MKQFKKIEANAKSILSMSNEQLSALAAITGKSISVGEAPLVGKYASIDGVKTSENEPKHPDLQFSYEWVESGDESGKLIRIYVGSEIHGPMLQWDWSGWRNCYGRGNHGKNGACGGNWSSDSKRFYETISEALDNRDYKVTDIEMHRSRLIEGPAIIEALRSLT